MATIAGPYRKTGEQFFDHGDARSETIAMMTRMINYMPKHGRLPHPPSRLGTERSANRHIASHCGQCSPHVNHPDQITQLLAAAADGDTPPVRTSRQRERAMQQAEREFDANS